MAATTHMAARAPTPTDHGDPYLAARSAVRIWVRSPHSAAKITTNADRTTLRDDGSRSTDSSAPERDAAQAYAAPARNMAATMASTAWWGSSLNSATPTVTAMATWARKAAAAPS